MGVCGRPARFRWFGTAVLGFGLVHGLGLATRFQALTVPADEKLIRLLAFNLGIELGQLLGLYLLYVIGDVVVRRVVWPRVERALFTDLVVAGLVAGITLPLT